MTKSLPSMPKEIVIMKNDDMRELLRHSVCQWCYGKNCQEILPCCIKLGDVDIWHTATARIQVSQTNGVEVAVIGECVDVREGYDAEKIAESLSLLDGQAFEVEKENLCGDYVIFRFDHGDVRVYGDAIHMMSVYYGINKHAGVVASCEALIVEDVSEISPVSAKVLAGAYESGKYLAGDMTMYDDVKALLPNHYLSVKEAKSVRYFPREDLKVVRTEAAVDAIIDNTIQMVEHCIRQFAKRMKFASPLTPGGDSRLNCAFLNKLIPQDEVLYYVIRTTEMKAFQENEILVKRLADEFGFHDFHFYQETETLTDERVATIKRVFGPIREWPKKIWAYHPDLKDRNIVSGALIGHILGGELGKNMPEWLVGLWFMKIRQRNVSKFAGKAVAEWYRDAMSAVKKGYSKFDMWYWEIRCGRWNANTISRDDIIGIHDINIYNSHRIINEWCKIPKRLRVRKLIHKRMLMRLCPSVADVTFNPCAHRGSRMRLPILAKIIPPWCRWIIVHFMEMRRRGR